MYLVWKIPEVARKCWGITQGYRAEKRRPVMEDCFGRHGEQISGVSSCFDRRVIMGSLTDICSPRGMAAHLTYHDGGFVTYEFREITGTVEDPKFVWVDDVLLAIAAPDVTSPQVVAVSAEAATADGILSENEVAAAAITELNVEHTDVEMPSLKTRLGA